MFFPEKKSHNINIVISGYKLNKKKPPVIIVKLYF